MVKILPAILATSEGQYQNDISRINGVESLQEGWVHIDLMDNIFVQNEQSSFAAQSKSIDADIVAKYPISLKKEAHLMVEDPSKWTEKLSSTGFERVVGHIEVGKDEVRRFIEKAKGIVPEVGLAVNPETHIGMIRQFAKDVNAVLVMSVRPGRQGQRFMPEVLSKIRQLKALRPDLIVGVDGGISTENARLIVEAGADYLVIGSHLLEGDIDANLEKIWETIRTT